MTMANQKAQYTEDAVGQNHPTLADTVNRCAVGLNNFRLIKSGATLTLEPVNGNLVDINGKMMAVTTIPTLGVGGLSASTSYYIYLYDSSGTATLEAVATGYTVDSKGRANKTGDATRRLMGMARTTAGTAWADTDAQRFVVSRDNRRTIRAMNFFAAARSTASASFAELGSAERVEFLCWAFDAVLLSVAGDVSNATGSAIGTSIGVDDATPEEGRTYTTNTAGAYGTAVVSLTANLTDGYHYATVLGLTGAGTANWTGAATAGSRTSIHAVVKG
jgi:hypothetical protein